MENDFSHRILHQLQLNSAGLTITEIANNLSASRTTITKYVKQLLQANQVQKRKIGRYALYFISEDGQPVSEEFLQFYEGFLYGLKKVFPNREGKLKEVGKYIAKYYSIHLGHFQDFIRDLYDPKITLPLSTIVETFEEIIMYRNIFRDTIQLTSFDFNPQTNEFKMRYANSRFLKEDLVYHGYIVCGYLETLHEEATGRDFSCEITGVRVEADPAESSVEITIKAT